jgi:hypothetical protein
MNGAGAIHDYELARVGATTESVARYIRSGEFGLWRETGELNEVICEYDIIHGHPNCDGGALGAASYRDFLIFARSVEDLEGGIMLSFGSAIMSPEVYLKALAMARNVAHQRGRAIKHFTTAVFDLVPIQGDIHHELPKTDPGYYFRPHKTILVRTVADGGESFYFCGDHRATVPALRRALLELT